MCQRISRTEVYAIAFCLAALVMLSGKDKFGFWLFMVAAIVCTVVDIIDRIRYNKEE